jgi:dTDP-4-amino-4,6-dideoxygalactose transaminase
MGRIFDLASRRGLRVVEDAAHAYTSLWHGCPVGALDSDASVLSFYATKTIATGEGGMLLTRNDDIARRARVMRLHGISRDAFDRYTSPQAPWFYEVVAPGFKYNMMDLVAAIGIHQLRKAPAFRERREQIALRYDDMFRDLPLTLPAHVRDGGDRHSWHLYIVRLTSDAPRSRDEFIQGLQGRGIGTSVHYIPLHLHPYWRDTYALRSGDFPRAQRAYEGAVSLPIYSRMTDQDVERVGRAVRELLS